VIVTSKLLRLSNFRVDIGDDRPLEGLVAARLGLSRGQALRLSIVRKALDARRSEKRISFVYTLQLDISESGAGQKGRWENDPSVVLWNPPEQEPIKVGSRSLSSRPVVIGFGPAGMFAALKLSAMGYRPLVLERGADVEQRQTDVAAFWDRGILDETSNVQFGEGGAGTFSDGKLTTRVNDPRMDEVLEAMVAAGAPPEIRWWYKPHIGTDRLRQVVKSIRNQIVAAGGEVRFKAHVTDFRIEQGCLNALQVNGGEWMECDAVFLGIGHSARDTYARLNQLGVAMEAKPFAIGARIEHPQEMVDQAQFGTAAGHPKLGAADYSLVYHDRASGRTVYSFCMCPGGVVIGASSESGGIVVNGMSDYRRASGAANSAVVVNVTPDDFGPGILAGVDFQRLFERKAYALAGGYQAPVQAAGDFLQSRVTEQKFLLQPSYGPAVKRANLDDCLPDYVTASMRRALPDFGRKIRGFDHPGAVLTGVETRTSAPVRILRNPHTRNSVNISGLYPMGEGAGYAGGIMSAALDGLNTAMAFIAEYRPF
jgi:uncharacterized FAD-dependent dehydrogenase